MVADTNKATGETTKKLQIDEKLKNLYALQVIHSRIDKIHDLMGALPLEVQDLEDKIVGLKTRIDKYNNEIEELKKLIREEQGKKADADEKIKRFNTQLQEVKNNREYDAILKEMEYEKLEKELSDKKIKEYNEKIEDAERKINNVENEVKEEEANLEHKKKELAEIEEENKNEENNLKSRKEKIEQDMEDRYVKAFHRIRSSVRNGLAVVTFHRDACGGCFNRIPPQRQLDIASRRRVIVCEHCGRILVDSKLATEVKETETDSNETKE